MYVTAQMISCEIHDEQSNSKAGTSPFFLGFSLGKDSFTSVQYSLLWPPQVCDGSKQPAYYHVLCL